MSDLEDLELRLLLRGSRKGVLRCSFVLGVLFLLTYFSGSVSGQRLERWVYAPANLLVRENVDRLEQLMREAAGVGFTHLLLSDSKFSRLHEMDERYFRHVERVRKLSDELQLRLAPAGAGGVSGGLFKRTAGSESESGRGTAGSKCAV